MPLEEQHQPTRYVDLRRSRRAVANLLASALEDELQGLGPLVVDTEGSGRPVRQHGSWVILETAEAPACADVGLRPDFVHKLSVSAVRLAGRAADHLPTREQKRRANAFAEVPGYYER